MGAYPPAPAVELNGKRFAEKSNVDDTEYDLPSREAGLPSSRGSSSTNDSRRDDDILGRDDISEAAPSCITLELASDASSKESRDCACSPLLGGIAIPPFRRVWRVGLSTAPGALIRAPLIKKRFKSEIHPSKMCPVSDLLVGPLLGRRGKRSETIVCRSSDVDEGSLGPVSCGGRRSLIILQWFKSK